MADAELALPQTENTAVEVRAAKAESAVHVPEPKKARPAAFVFALLAAMTILLAYESLAQEFYPESSLLGILHSYGYLKSYPVAYDPGKGIWRLLGWTGSGMMVLMMAYTLRKRRKLPASTGSMRAWLNFHMFLGIAGPILITFHTTFKFNGLIATSYWSMVATVAFGILGRYIYVQIPRGLKGTELDIRQIEGSVGSMDMEIKGYLDGAELKNPLFRTKRPALHELIKIDEVCVRSMEGSPLKALFTMMGMDIRNRLRAHTVEKALSRDFGLDRGKSREIAALAKRKAALIRKKNFLFTSHKILGYWHVAHIPLAIVMFAIMFLHVIIYYVFRAGL